MFVSICLAGLPCLPTHPTHPTHTAPRNGMEMEASPRGPFVLFGWKGLLCCSEKEICSFN